MTKPGPIVAATGVPAAADGTQDEVVAEGADAVPSEVWAEGDPDHDPDGEPVSRRRKRRGGNDKMPGEEVSSLNLTPMMDIMTILLVFLVMSFANDPGNINASASLQPPKSDAEEMMKAATSVTITSENILVNDEEVMKVADVKHTTGQSSLVKEVRDKLEQRKEHLKKLESMGGQKFDGRLLVIAHETTSYAVIADVLYSAGAAQFSKYELVVMKGPSEMAAAER